MLSNDDARTCYRQLLDAPLPERLERLRRDALERACAYATLRTQWQLGDPTERFEIDRRRTIAHEAFIATINALSRNMAASGLPIEWRARLPDRKTIGDFACYVACFLGLEAR